MIERQPVTSSGIVSLGYDEEAQILEVEFKPSRKGAETTVFQYHPIHLPFWDKLMEPEQSKGKMIFAMIKARDADVTRIA